MSIRVLYSDAFYIPLEGAALIWDDRWPRNGTRPGIICCHGHGFDWSLFQPGRPGIGLPAQVVGLVKAGYIVMPIDAGGPLGWFNTSVVDAVEAARVWLQSVGGAKAGKIGLVGYSMGGGSSLIYTRYHPTFVERMVLFAPATDLAAYHANPTYTAEIDTSYGGNYNVNSVGHNPLAQAVDFRGFPIRIYQGSADTLVTPAMTDAFVAAVNDPLCARILLPNATHTDVGFYVSPSDVVDFFMASLI